MKKVSERHAFQKEAFQQETAHRLRLTQRLDRHRTLSWNSGREAHRWASEGMPVRREGRFTVADREAVSAWLGRESHMPKPAHVMTADADMTAALKESIAAARKRKQ
jgi:hypothetical protein